MGTTRASRHIRAPRERVYRALLHPTQQDEMTITYTLADRDGGTDLVGLHEGLPPGVAPADNEIGWNMSLAKLAALVEAEQ